MFTALLGDKQFMADVQSSYYLEQVMTTESQLLKDIHKEYEALLVKKKALTRRKEIITQLKKSTSSYQRTLDKKKLSQKRYIQTLQSEIKKLERHNRDLEKMSRELSQLIKDASKDAVNYATGKFIRPVKGWISLSLIHI